MAKAITVHTEKLGKITRKKLNDLVKEHGSLKAVADHLNVAPSTVRNWRYELNLAANKVKEPTKV